MHNLFGDLTFIRTSVSLIDVHESPIYSSYRSLVLVLQPHLTIIRIDEFSSPLPQLSPFTVRQGTSAVVASSCGRHNFHSGANLGST